MKRELHKTSRVCIIHFTLQGEWFKARSIFIFRRQQSKKERRKWENFGPEDRKEKYPFYLGSRFSIEKRKPGGKAYENFLNEKFPLSRNRVEMTFHLLFLSHFLNEKFNETVTI